MTTSSPKRFATQGSPGAKMKEQKAWAAVRPPKGSVSFLQILIGLGGVTLRPRLYVEKVTVQAIEPVPDHPNRTCLQVRLPEYSYTVLVHGSPTTVRRQLGV